MSLDTSFVLGGPPIPSSSAGLSAGSPRAGRPTETAGGHVGRLSYPIRSRLSQRAAGRCGAGAHETTHHTAGGKKLRDKLFELQVVEF